MTKKETMSRILIVLFSYGLLMTSEITLEPTTETTGIHLVTWVIICIMATIGCGVLAHWIGDLLFGKRAQRG